MKNTPKYIRCRNCGKYITSEEVLYKAYCSNKCAIRFYICKYCGKYYTRKTKEDSTEFCSPVCEKDFNNCTY